MLVSIVCIHSHKMYNICVSKLNNIIQAYTYRCIQVHIHIYILIYMKHEKYMNIEKEIVFSLLRLIWLFTWRRQWQPTAVLLPGKSHGRRSLVGRSPWGC